MNLMNHESLRALILRTLSEVVPDADTEGLDPDISFQEQVKLDSIDFLRLMMGLEQELNITIFEFDYPKLSTLNNCQHYLIQRIDRRQTTQPFSADYFLITASTR